VPASSKSVIDLDLATASRRTIDVVVRSAAATPIEGGEVFLRSGKLQIKNVAELLNSHAMGAQAVFAKPVVADRLPTPLAKAIHPGDLLAHAEHAAQGDVTVCAIAYNSDLSDSQVWRDHILELPLKCEQIGPNTSVVVIRVSPLPRFD